jgi:hypothetical protein
MLSGGYGDKTMKTLKHLTVILLILFLMMALMSVMQLIFKRELTIEIFVVSLFLAFTFRVDKKLDATTRLKVKGKKMKCHCGCKDFYKIRKMDYFYTCVDCGKMYGPPNNSGNNIVEY